MKEQDIIYENGKSWVLKDTARNSYTVFRCGVTHSTSDSAYPLNEDGLSLAKARVDYFAKRSSTQSSCKAACVTTRTEI